MTGKEKLILLVVMLGVLMTAIDSTVVLLALPTMVSSLHSNIATMIWVIVAYILAISIFTTQFGKVGDIFGRGRMFNIGFAIFTIGSFLCGAAISDTFLIGARVLQAIGAAFLQANSTVIIADTFPPEKRGKAFGYTLVGWNAGALLGIIIGGIVTTYIGWQYIFYINIPIGIAAVAIGAKVLIDNKRFKHQIDFPGMVLLGLTLFALTYSGLDFAINGPSAYNISALVASLLLIIIFIIVEKRSRNPTIVFAAFKNRTLTASTLAAFFQSMAMIGAMFMIIIYLQGIRGLSPLVASLYLAPGYIIGSLFGPRIGDLADKMGPRLIATLGLAFICLALLIYSTVSLTTNLYVISVAALFMGLGGAMFFPANNKAITSSTSRENYGSVTGFVRTLGNIGLLLSYVISLSVASIAISRAQALQIFVGTQTVVGGVAAEFVGGVHLAVVVSLILAIIAAVLSAMRGKVELVPSVSAQS